MLFRNFYKEIYQKKNEENNEEKRMSWYSSLSNKRAGWNKMCRVENWGKFESFENLNP